jgi:glycosyltransferase involved in cell wall biosynthesis
MQLVRSCNELRNDENPTVSVILPVYNGENYLRSAIESVLGQTFDDFELIVVDDGSSDSTPEIAQSYRARVRYVRQNNTGVAGAFNHGLKLASGRYISWLSHDDLFAPTKLEKQVAALDLLDAPGVCYTDAVAISSRGEVIAEYRLPQHERGEALRHVLTGGPISSASYSICYDRRCVEQVGGYSDHWRYTQDAEMLMRLARNFPLIRIPEILMQIREHPNRGIHSKEWRREAIRFYREHLRTIPLDELFPDLKSESSRSERAQAYLWLGDKLAGQADPVYRVAYSQYRKALLENPADGLRLLRRMAGLWWRRRKEDRHQ